MDKQFLKINVLINNKCMNNIYYFIREIKIKIILNKNELLYYEFLKNKCSWAWSYMF